MATLVWDDDNGYGHVDFNREFHSREAITCADAINDWLLGLTYEYNDQIKRMDSDWRKVRRDAERHKRRRAKP